MPPPHRTDTGARTAPGSPLPPPDSPRPAPGIPPPPCALALARALNYAGRFARAVALADNAAGSFAGNSLHAVAGLAELAIAHTHLGHWEHAEQALIRARGLLAEQPEPWARAACDRARGVLFLEREQHAQAAERLRHAVDAFAACGTAGETAAARRELAAALAPIDAPEALRQLDRARAALPGDNRLHQAHCDRIRALVCHYTDRHAEGVELLQGARAAFARAGLAFHVALCNLYLGTELNWQNRYQEALQTHTQAAESFAAQRLERYVAMAQLNMAADLYTLNRYQEALPLFETSAAQARLEGSPGRAAASYTNMGLCCDRLGRYAQALALHSRAYEELLALNRPAMAAVCQINLAGTYRSLGRHAEALDHYRQARETLTRGGWQLYAAQCNSDAADLYLAIGQYAEGLECLREARRWYEQDGTTVYAAVCDRETARFLVATGQPGAALPLLPGARTALAAQALQVDVALCDLAAGEAYLGLDRLNDAARCFTAALAVLPHGSPDEAWRAPYGLGRCALRQGRRGDALEHWLSAIAIANHTRAALPTERLSGDFFALRRGLYHEALRLALDIGAFEQALAVAEAGKPQLFLGWAAQQDRPPAGADGHHRAELLEREAALRREIQQLHRALRPAQARDHAPILRSGDEEHGYQVAGLSRLAEISSEYEGLVERLRVVDARWSATVAQARFSLPQLRAAAAGRLPDEWACIDYYLLDDTLVTFYLDSARMVPRARSLDSFDRLALRECTNPAQAFRELVYRGSLRGFPLQDAPGPGYLRHLYDLLVPPEVAGLGPGALLIVAPHGPLHALPFHALQSPDGPLAARVAIVHVPSLSALSALLAQPRAPANSGQVLACGLSEFEAGLQPLPHTLDEINALKGVMGASARALWGTAATRAALLQLSAAGALADYPIIHFATHAVMDPWAPSQSRIVLAEDNLTCLDILNLGLGPCTIVLSACSGALGEQHAGDETMGLAQAFLFAGARTVVASLWHVEDTSTTAFMQRLYRGMLGGENVAQALRHAQIDMAAQGAPPYQWAPFVAIGLP